MNDIFRLRKKVPVEAVNLGWIDLPELDPLSNVNIIRVGDFIPENVNLQWLSSKGSSVPGVFVNNTDVTGFVYATQYNISPSGDAASGTITSGVAKYTNYRPYSTEVAPSGFVVNNLTAKIEVKPPRGGPLDVWRLRVRDGLVQKRYILQSRDGSWLSKIFSPGDELMLYFSIPETCLTPYYTGASVYTSGYAITTYRDEKIVEANYVLAEVIDQNTVQLPYRDIVEIFDFDINQEHVSVSTSGLVTKLTQMPKGIFNSWNPETGRVTLNLNLSLTDEVRVGFRYVEPDYLFEGYLDDFGTYHDLDLNPSPGHFYDSVRPSLELLNLPVYVYLIPSAAYKIKNANGTYTQDRTIYSGTRWTNSFLRWERTAQPIGDPNASTETGSPTDTVTNPCLARSTFGYGYFGSAVFTDNVTVTDSVTPGVITSGTISATGLAQIPCALILAKVYITPNSIVDNVSILDTRSRGGGIPEEIKPNAPELPGQVQRIIESFWDISGWNGRPVPLAGAIQLELPKEILTGTNRFNLFTQDEIEKLAEDLRPAGNKVIIKYV